MIGLTDGALCDLAVTFDECMKEFNLQVIPAEMTLLNKLRKLIALHFKVQRFEEFYADAWVL